MVQHSVNMRRRGLKPDIRGEEVLQYSAVEKTKLAALLPSASYHTTALCRQDERSVGILLFLCFLFALISNTRSFAQVSVPPIDLCAEHIRLYTKAASEDIGLKEFVTEHCRQRGTESL